MPSLYHDRLLEFEEVGDVTVVRFTRPNILEEDKIQAIGAQLLELVRGGNCRKCLVDFGRVESLASTMVGKLFALHKNLSNVGGRLAVCKLNPVIYEIFDTLKVTRLLHLYEDEEEALQSF